MVENRRFKRLNANWVVKLRATRYTDTSVKRMQERIRNISIGGVYIETSVPFDVGTHVDLVFAIPGREGRISTKGIVRWSNDGRSKEHPVGMGIEFLEVSTPTREVLEQYIAADSTKKLLEPILRTPVHCNLLRIYGRKIGGQFKVDVLAQFLACSNAQLLEAINDFSSLRLILFSGDTVEFVKSEDADLAEAIRSWNTAASP
jgi:uncharacterized protein (TIGR02266 family)